jgi:hypothetical protein
MLLQRSSTCEKAPYFAFHLRIAIGLLKEMGFRNKVTAMLVAKIGVRSTFDGIFIRTAWLGHRAVCFH